MMVIMMNGSATEKQPTVWLFASKCWQKHLVLLSCFVELKHIIVTQIDFLLAIRIQEVRENYSQGHGTRCHLNRWPQQRVSRNQERHWFKSPTWTLWDHCIVHQNSWEPREEKVLIHFSVREMVSQSFNFPCCSLPICKQKRQSNSLQAAEGK